MVTTAGRIIAPTQRRRHTVSWCAFCYLIPLKTCPLPYSTWLADKLTWLSASSTSSPCCQQCQVRKHLVKHRHTLRQPVDKRVSNRLSAPSRTITFTKVIPYSTKRMTTSTFTSDASNFIIIRTCSLHFALHITLYFCFELWRFFMYYWTSFSRSHTQYRESCQFHDKKSIEKLQYNNGGSYVKHLISESNVPASFFIGRLSPVFLADTLHVRQVISSFRLRDLLLVNSCDSDTQNLLRLNIWADDMFVGCLMKC